LLKEFLLQMGEDCSLACEIEGSTHAAIFAIFAGAGTPVFTPVLCYSNCQPQPIVVPVNSMPLSASTADPVPAPAASISTVSASDKPQVPTNVQAVPIQSIAVSDIAMPDEPPPVVVEDVDDAQDEQAVKDLQGVDSDKCDTDNTVLVLVLFLPFYRAGTAP
jgi:hypothetical protein